MLGDSSTRLLKRYVHLRTNDVELTADANFVFLGSSCEDQAGAGCFAVQARQDAWPS
jgi:hypothetical protein